MSLKRTASPEGAGAQVGESGIKHQKLGWYYVLEPESKQQSSDEDSDESIHSIQEKETDAAKDTSDTTTHTDWTSDDDEFTMKVEYEVASLSEKENPLGDDSLSSDTDDIVCAAASVINLSKEKLSSFADSSGNSDSNTLFDPEIPRADYWTCLQCKNKNNNPLYRYCEKCFKRQTCVQCNRSKKFACFVHCDNCFKLRKNLFPPRPRKKRRRRKNNSNKNVRSLEKSISTASTVSLSEASQENVDYKNAIAGPSNLHLDSGLGSSQDLCSQDSKSEVDSQELASNSTDSLSLQTCITCMTNPKNGIFIHGKVGHVCCCYKCALKVWTQSGKCPLCNGKVRSVLKLIVQ